MSDKKGFISIIILFLVVAIALAVMPIIMNVVSYHAVNEYEKALFIAESGIKYYLKNYLITDNNWSDNNTAVNNKAFGGGTFSISVVRPCNCAPGQPTPNNPVNRIRLRSTGSVTTGRVFQRTIEEVLISNSAFQSTIYGTGPTTFQGMNSVTVNGDINISGPLNLINNGSVTVTGQQNTNLPNLAIPTVDWTYWQAQAAAAGAGHVLSGNQTFVPGTHSGIYYVNGTATILNNNNKSINITIIATGNIDINTNSKLTINPAAAGKPTLVSGYDVSLLNNNNLTVGGSIYAAHNLTMTGGSQAALTGSLIYGNQLNFTNNNKPVVMNSDSGADGSGFVGFASSLCEFKEI